MDLADGSVTSLIDKRDGWDAIAGRGNIVAREDDHGDLWEPYHALNGAQFVTMKERHPAPPPATFQPGASGVVVSGSVFSEFVGGAGQVSSRVRLYASLPRVEFRTRMRNDSKHVRYRVLFPSSLPRGQGVHEIPFGVVEHPEGVECPAQNWIDQSDGVHGLALLNRGLPGNNIADGTLLLSLLRSATIGGYGYGGGFEPGMGSDSGLELGKEFSFDYALLPHSGSWSEANVVRQALEFNQPLLAVSAAPHPGALPRRWGAVSVVAANVVVSAFKVAEDGKGLVLRLYETAGTAAGQVEIVFAVPVAAAEEGNLMEDSGKRLKLEGSSLRLDFRPFELKTIKFFST